MIFALSTDDRTLEVFDSEAEAISYAEGIDVEDGVWAFFDETGCALEATFTKPNQRGHFVVVSGVYTLHPAPDAPKLQDRLSEISSIENTGKFKNISEVEAWLASNQSFKRDA